MPCNKDPLQNIFWGFRVPTSLRFVSPVFRRRGIPDASNVQLGGAFDCRLPPFTYLALQRYPKCVWALDYWSRCATTWHPQGVKTVVSASCELDCMCSTPWFLILQLKMTVKEWPLETGPAERGPKLNIWKAHSGNYGKRHERPTSAMQRLGVRCVLLCLP